MLLYEPFFFDHIGLKATKLSKLVDDVTIIFVVNYLCNFTDSWMTYALQSVQFTLVKFLLSKSEPVELNFIDPFYSEFFASFPVSLL